MPGEQRSGRTDVKPRTVFPDYARIPAVVVDTAGVEHPVTLTIPVSGYGYPGDGKVHGAVAFGDEEASFRYEDKS